MRTGYALRWWALALLCAAQFIVILDTSIIGVALPAIQDALGLSPAGLQWVFNAYVIVFGGLLLLGGRLADLLGRRGVFVTGFGTLAAGSALAGLADVDTVLLVGRAVQGFGAALIAPAALSIVMEVFTDPRELAKAFGFWGGAAAAGGTAGVFLGGVITEWLSWRWTFLINVPLAALVLLAAPLVLPRGRREAGSVDVAGAVLVTVPLVLAVYALVTGEQAGWLSLQTLGLLAISGLLLVAFVVTQARRREPLVPLSIFRAPNLAMGNLVMALLGAAWIPMWFFLNLYLQEVLHYSALGSGLALVPMTTLIMFLMIVATPRVSSRFGFPSVLGAGLFVLAGSMLLMAALPIDGSFWLHVLPVSLLGALGMSLAYVPATMAGMSGARPEESGLASGLINTTYQIGSALGLAGMVAVSTTFADAARTQGVEAVAAMSSGFSAAFVGAALIAGLGAVVALASIRAPARGSADEADPEAKRRLAA